MATPKVDTAGSHLSQADLKLLNQALYKLDEARERLDLAERAGVPNVADVRAIRDDVFTQVTAIKQTYFPGQQ